MSPDASVEHEVRDLIDGLMQELEAVPDARLPAAASRQQCLLS